MADVSVGAPNQGVANSSWKEIFLDSSGNPRSFIHASLQPKGIVDGFITVLLALATMAAIVYLLLSAWWMVTSGGAEDKYLRGKIGLMNAVIGIVILMAMWALIAAVRALALGTIG